MRQNLGEASTPGSARKRGRPSGKTVPVSAGSKKAGKRVSGGGKRVSSGSAIERELDLRAPSIGAVGVKERKGHADKGDSWRPAAA